MRSAFSDSVRSVLNRIGIDVYRFPMLHDERAIRARIMRGRDINVVLDIGANAGQYGRALRRFGYAGRITSFEPVETIFKELQKSAARDSKWECRQLALGERAGVAEINVADTLSSLLPKSETADDSLPFTSSGKESIRIETLDGIRTEHYATGDRVWLKLDVQGYEMNVLSGAAQALREVEAIEIELSLRPLYAGQVPYPRMSSYLESNGFELWAIKPTHIHPRTGQLIEMDGIFVRRGMAETGSGDQAELAR